MNYIFIFSADELYVSIISFTIKQLIFLLLLLKGH
jgi:hypothetical protein